MSTISTDLSALGSPTFDKNTEGDVDSTASSPLVTTPPETKVEVHDPPSPPMSDASAPMPKATSAAAKQPTATGAPTTRKSRLPSADFGATPKPKPRGVPTAARPSGGLPSTGGAPLRTPANRNVRPGTHKLPSSNSLSHIRTLTAQMQRLEARVQSARSKLPAPTHTPPRASPRTDFSSSTTSVPSSITIRSRKRTVGSTASSSVAGDDTTPTNPSIAATPKPSHVPRLSTSGISRLSFGPLPNRNPDSDASRPSSRASISSYARPSSRTEMVPPPRPMSRSSLSGARTPLGRPRSSLGGSLHGHSASVSHIDLEEEDESEFRTPSRRGTYSKFDLEGGVQSAIPMPNTRRQSGSGAARRTSTGPSVSGRPSTSNGRKLSDLGETY